MGSSAIVDNASHEAARHDDVVTDARQDDFNLDLL